MSFFSELHAKAVAALMEVERLLGIAATNAPALAATAEVAEAASGHPELVAATGAAVTAVQALHDAVSAPSVASVAAATEASAKVGEAIKPTDGAAKVADVAAAVQQAEQPAA